MKRIHSHVAIAALFLTSSMAALAANQWKGPFIVTSVISGPDGGFLLLLPASDAACGASGNQFNVNAGANGMTAEGVKAALAVALTAASTGRPISIVVDTALPGCPVQQIRFDPT